MSETELKWKFIVNPNSGLKKCLERWQKAEIFVKQSGIDYDVTLTTGPFQGEELALKAVNEGFNRLIVVSGDGVLNEVTNGLLKLPYEKRQEVALGVLPFGTGNDYNTVLGLPWKPENAIDYLLNKTDVTTVNAGKFKVLDTDFEKYFINVLDTGISSLVGHAANLGEGSFIKGPRKYTYLALKKLLTVKQKRATIKLDDQEPIDIKIMLISIGLGKCIGGGMLCCVDAHPQHDAFNVFITRKVSKLQTLIGIKRIYKGKHKTMKGTLFTYAKQIELKVESPIPFEFDGEVYVPESIGTHLTVNLVPKALKVLYYPEHPSIYWLSQKEVEEGKKPRIVEDKGMIHGQARRWQETH
ncbi:MAG: diacylglycerol/lipid kinase family protein [Candidatus Heimdallarchaeaceae archaeon]